MIVNMIASFMFGTLAFSNLHVLQVLGLATDPLYLAVFNAAVGYAVNDLTNKSLNITIKQKQKIQLPS
jgi:hypothetical protein